VLVAGDVMLDHYLRGTVERTSPEAPVPILRVRSEEYILGGAGNVAANLAAMGARVTLAGLIGGDAGGPRLLDLMKRAGIHSRGIVSDPARPTTLKTRTLAQGQQILRIDREESGAPGANIEEKLLKRLNELLAECDGVVVSDYGKGVLSPRVLRTIIETCQKRGIPVVADPKGLDYSRYRGIDILTPNVKEAQAASGVAIADEASLARAAAVLNRQVQGKGMCITRGADGVAVFPRRGGPIFLPAYPREVFDVTGAGDTFIAHFALAYFQGLSIGDAAAWGNLAAGIVVGRLGVAIITPGELLGHGAGEGHLAKIRGADDLEPVLRALQAADRRVVFTNGCFDLLHVGHIHFLASARALGDCLVVAINSDESVRAVKGPPRPLLPEDERAALLASLHSVDFVVIFSERSPEQLIQRLRPDVLVKGGNFEPEEVVGRRIVEENGGQVRVLPLFGDHSVTGLLEQWAGAAGKLGQDAQATRNLGRDAQATGKIRRGSKGKIKSKKERGA